MRKCWEPCLDLAWSVPSAGQRWAWGLSGSLEEIGGKLTNPIYFLTLAEGYWQYLYHRYSIHHWHVCCSKWNFQVTWHFSKSVHPWGALCHPFGNSCRGRENWISCPLFTVKGKGNCSVSACMHPHPPSSAGIGCDSREDVKTVFSCKEQYSASSVGLHSFHWTVPLNWYGHSTPSTACNLFRLTVHAVWARWQSQLRNTL